MNERLSSYIRKLESGFFGFWVKNFRIAFLVTFLILFFGSYSLIQIPKESTPDIKFGIIQISTIYPGVNPYDVDNIITQKIEKEIKDLDGIKKLSSQSNVGISSTTVELFNGVDVSKVMGDIKDKIDALSFPEDVEDPRVVEISTMNELLFKVGLIVPTTHMSLDSLKDKAVEFIDVLEGKNGITSIEMDRGEESEYKVLVNKIKAEQLGLTLGEIASSLRAYNRNQPLGSHSIGDLKYDFRVQGEVADEKELGELPLRVIGSSVLRLRDVATVTRVYKNDDPSLMGFYQKTGYHLVNLSFLKKPGGNIFDISSAVKQSIDDLLKQPRFQGISAEYTQDLADVIKDDYASLMDNGVQTVVFVFLVAWLFIGLKEAFIATFAFPLALFVTFAYLYRQGMTLNFLTNFSLILTFGMGIDTVMVMIEGAYENVKKGFSPKNGVLIAIKDYKIPLIASAAANIIVFLPMMFLPDILGKFLSYIPITIFVTLIASLFLALTINCAIFYKVTQPLKTYTQDPEENEMLSPEDRELLAYDRQGKTLLTTDNYTVKDKLLDRMSDRYSGSLYHVVSTRRVRLAFVFLPLVLLIFTFIVLSPLIGFKLFPSGDNPYIEFSITAKEGTTSEHMEQYSEGIAPVLSSIPEIKNYALEVRDRQIDMSIILHKKKERDAKNQRNSFDVEKEITSGLSFLESLGLKVEGKVQEGGPPAGKAVGIQLIAQSNTLLPELIKVSKEFEAYLKTLQGAENISNSSSDTPGQFVFRFDAVQLKRLGLTPGSLLPELYSNLNGLKAGSIKGLYQEHDIVVKYDAFENGVNPEDVENTILSTPSGKLLIGSIASYVFEPSIASLKREDGNVIVNIESDVLPEFFPTDIQPQLDEFAEKYPFPEGISWVKKGENAENSELIMSTFVSFFIAVFMIFVILVLQFNSFAQPALILYCIVMALIGVNIGLWLTGNPYSMPFGIGFISLVGIIVNNAIVILDRINSNLSKGVEHIKAVVESGKSRLKPILISTISTIVGILPLALEDEFWAGLGYTVVFGLLVCTILTLYVIPALFFELFLKSKHDQHIRPRLRRAFQGLSKSIAEKITPVLEKTPFLGGK